MSLKYLTVATSRPETLFGDVAVAINPEDSRYSELIEKIKSGELIKLELALTQKEIPVILSDYVKLDFGTGALKITPAHDFNDSEIAKKAGQEFNNLNLKPVNIFTEKAEILNLEFIPKEFHGLSREKARKLCLEKLEQEGLLEGEEEYLQASSLHDRCGTLIEPYLSKQWFVSMQELAKLAIQALEQEKIKFYPERYSKTYLDWLSNIQDWCISRQLWWGHEIPVWSKIIKNNNILENTNLDPLDNKLSSQKYIFISENINSPDLDSENKILLKIILREKNLEIENLLKQADFKQEQDVLDTWFSSALWPFASQGWQNNNNLLINNNKNYWTNTLSTAREIINLWVSRMIFSSVFLTGKLPFRDILIHPVIQTPDGKRMSKSKGNAINPVELIQKYGADANRMYYCSLGIFSNQDIRFAGKKEKDGSWSSETIENNRKFLNKLWNACRFVINNINNNKFEAWDENSEIPELKSKLNLWIIWLWAKVLESAENYLNNYNFTDYLGCIEKFFKNDFCDWYLEFSKSDINNPETQRVLFYIIQQVIKALSPVVPHIAEELLEILNIKKSLSTRNFPVCKLNKNNLINNLIEEASQEVETLRDIIRAVRSFRQDILGLAPTRELNIFLESNINNNKIIIDWIDWSKLAKVKVTERNSAGFYIKNIIKNKIIVFLEIPAEINLAERVIYIEKNILKKQQEKISLETRLENAGFMSNASENLKQEIKSRVKLLNEELKDSEEILRQIKIFI